MKSHRYRIQIILVILLSTISCKNKIIHTSSQYSDQLNIVIKDYYQKNKDYIRNYSFFSLNYKKITDGNYYYSILPMRDKSYTYSVDVDYENSYLPSDYIKFSDKVFFIEDDNVSSPKEGLLEYLDALQLLDSTSVKVELGMIKPEDVDLKPTLTDDSLEAVNYIICKNEPSKIKKKIRSRSYIPPDDKRFENLCD